MLVDQYLKLPTAQGIKTFLKSRYADQLDRAPLTVAIYLNCTTAKEMLALTGREAIRRLKAIYRGKGDTVIPVLEKSLIQRNGSLDAPVFMTKDGKACSRTTLWRQIHKVGHVALRRLAKKLMSSLAVAYPEDISVPPVYFRFGVPFQRLGTTQAEQQAIFDARFS